MYKTNNHQCLTCRDPRVHRSWPLNNLTLQWALLAFYLVFVKILGPKIMEKRKPIKVEKLMIIYNFVQVVANFWVGYQTALVMLHKEYSWFCSQTKFETADEKYFLQAELCAFSFTLLKWFDLTDTIFMVLKKNFHQITSLHVYHHSMMVVVTTLGLNFYPTQHACVLAVTNSAAHFLMYSYYLVTVVNPATKQSIRLKKLVTQTQMLHHFLVAVHSAIAFFNPYCRRLNKLVPLTVLTQACLILIMFAKFYHGAYIKPLANKKKM